MTPFEARALRVLERGPTSSSTFGGELWPGGRQVHHGTRGPRHSSNGGGDYAAQMLLGRLRKKGWAHVLDGEGSSVWAITSEGRVALEEASSC